MKNFSETVRNSADIVRVVSDYVSLKGTGSALKALCPFHSEKTPSFSVHREKQIFHCFGCGAGGDVFSFVMLAEKVSFPESVRIVAEKCGIPVPADTRLDDGKADERKQLFEIYERASSYFHDMLSSEEAAPARQVLAKRRIQAEFIDRFRLGYAPSSGLLAHLRPKDPLSTGLFVKNDRGEVYDRFRRRLIFPIWNERGKTIAFGGRALAADAQPKYLNSAESPLYSKSNVLYALHLARETAQKSRRMVVVEGYFDCLSLHQVGVENVVASCGTSLTQQQVALMGRYVPEVVMNYDPDAAGQSAMRRSIDLLLAKGLRVRILHLPGGLDPDDFVREQGAAVYSDLLSKAPYFWQYLTSEATRQYDIAQPAMKANAVRDVMEHVVKIQDSVERLEVAKAVAETFKVPEAVIFEQLKVAPRAPVAGPVARKVTFQTERRLSPAEKQLIHALLQEPGVGKTLEPCLEYLKEAWSRPILEGLIKDPTQNVETVLQAVPDEDLRREVRAAILEPFGKIKPEEALASLGQLYQEHLVKKEKEIREQLKQYGTGAAPADLVRQQMEIAAEKSRVRALKP
ncbi:MAG: DNA primase [Acidobacteria bacterium]|nr:DNA primase [Acidobacteriota bacterium]